VRLSSQIKIQADALIVEDEPSLSIALELSLKKMGFFPLTAASIEQAYTFLEDTQYTFDLILLDRQLPDGDSIDICHSLRNSGFKGMILMLTASGDTSSRVEGLRAGADDYLPKPFSWEELEARIEALKWRMKPELDAEHPHSEAQNEKLHLWRIDSTKHQVLTPKGWTKLTAFEFKLLSYLIQEHGTPVSKERLLRQVWGLKILPKTRTVDWFIGRLRKLIEEDPKKPTHIVNMRGRGYVFKP